jgi:glycosyltransferase involved in cell wall biosynthesis
LIAKGIESVLNQSFNDWELIIVDDGSTDNTKEIIESFNDPRIKYVFQQNAERSVARNNGIRHASSDWICFLDSDDYFLSNHLETFHSFIKDTNPGPSFIVTGGYDEKEGAFVEKPLYEIDSGQHPAKFILDQTTITPISVCIHKTCLKKHKFIEKYKKSYWEDTHLWIRLAIDFPFYQLSNFTNVLAEHKGRSVNSKITMERVNDHISMIMHLFENYQNLLANSLTTTDYKKYIDRKYRMFLYQARQNKQIMVAMNIWSKAIFYRPSTYLISEFPKICLNKLNIGIHDR